MYENRNKGYKNEDVFFLLRFAITGNPVGAPVGEIIDIIGLSEAITRIDNAMDYLKSVKEEDSK